MTIRAVLFDIGGVLEITPRTGWIERWEAELQLEPGQLEERTMDVQRGGTLGTMSLAQVEQRFGEIFGLDRSRVDALMTDFWDEYLGTLNVELRDFFASLRPRYRTGILSTSFVGAREKEQERYGFGDLCDVIIYSHEEGIEKPDPRNFVLACERLGGRGSPAKPDEIVFLDDVEGHIAAARAFGIHAVLFTETKKAIADIQAILDGG